MVLFRAVTPGTLVVLAGTVLMILVTLNAPIIKSIYFLSANFSGDGGGASLDGRVTLGTLGYCSGNQCITPTLGYELNADSLLGVASQYINIPNSLIKWLTYVLVLHPIAAGLGLIATILGLLGHIRELSLVLSLTATWLAGIASTITLIAFAFDIAVFTIVRSRINSAAQSNGGVTVDTAASYGSAIWMTLAAFILFAISGCCFRFGRRVARERRANASESVKPSVDPYYASQARLDAEKAEHERKNESSSRAERGLPSFAENSVDPVREERIPLRSYVDDSYHDPYAERENIAGVGQGFGRRYPPNTRQSTGNTSEHDQSYNNGYRTDGHDQIPSHAESFSSMYPNARQQNASTGNVYPGGYSASSTPAPYPQTSIPGSYHQAGTPLPSLPQPQPAAYAAYNNTADYNTGYGADSSPYYAQDQQQYGASQTNYETPVSGYPATSTVAYTPVSRAQSTPYADLPQQTYAEPTSYTNQQDTSYLNARQESHSRDDASQNSAYGGVQQEEPYQNPYYIPASALQPHATGGTTNTIRTALPPYQSEAGDRLPSPGANEQQQQSSHAYPQDLSQSWNGYSPDSAGVGRQRTVSPRGPRQMSRSQGASEDQGQRYY